MIARSCICTAEASELMSRCVVSLILQAAYLLLLFTGQDPWDQLSCILTDIWEDGMEKQLMFTAHLQADSCCQGHCLGMGRDLLKSYMVDLQAACSRQGIQSTGSADKHEAVHTAV